MTSPSDKRSFFWWLLAPLCLLFVGAYTTVDALYGLTFAPLGRDQGIFQYTAWALRHGERLYVDFHEINGPLPHVLHWVYQLLGGEDSRTFRLIDLVVTGTCYAWIGSRIPRAESARARSIRVAWALGGFIVFASQYVSYGWWHTAQREHYFTLLLGLAIAAILPDVRSDFAAGAVTAPWRRTARWAFAGICIAAPCFGKPTCALYFLLFVAAAFWLRRRARLVEDSVPPTNERRLWVALGAGVAIASVFFLSFIARYGNFGAAWKFVVVETSRFHRYFWILSPAECYGAHGNAPRLNIAFITLLIAGVAAARRKLPRHAVLALVPLIGGIVTYFAQQKGFPYHLHPVGFGVRLLWLFLVEDGIAKVAKDGPRKTAREALAFAATALVLVLWYASGDSNYAESRNQAWRSTGETEFVHLTHFRSKDFEPAYLAEAADYVRGVVSPHGRIQMYGFDPYLMFRARRLSASPFIYGFDLQAKSVVEEKRTPLPPETRAWIEQLLSDNREELAEKLAANPPEAIVFVDRTPFDYPDDSRADFADCCAKADAFVTARYHADRTFGPVRVWLRNDLTSK